MPKAKPLPDDPIEREKVLKARRKAVEKVLRWRKRHPDKARVYNRINWQRERTEKEVKRLREALYSVNT